MTEYTVRCKYDADDTFMAVPQNGDGLVGLRALQNETLKVSAYVRPTTPAPSPAASSPWPTRSTGERRRRRPRRPTSRSVTGSASFAVPLATVAATKATSARWTSSTPTTPSSRTACG